MTTEGIYEGTQPVKPGEFDVPMVMNYAQLYRALLGVEPLGRGEAKAVVQLVGSLVKPSNEGRSMRIERMCAQIDADAPMRPKHFEYLMPDGTVAPMQLGPWPPPGASLKTVTPEELESIVQAHATELGAVTLELEGVQRDHSELAERYDRIVNELRSIIATCEIGDGPAFVKALEDVLAWV